MRLYMGLVHFPVYNKNGEKIASAITTLDIHDLARLARTYDVRRVFIITPLQDQQELARRVLRHWIEGYGGRYNWHRKEALECVSVVESIEQAVARIQEIEGELPITIATDAGYQEERSISYEEARESIWRNQVAVLIFGTAWGLHEEVIRQSDRVLAPVLGKKGYNHLSVRTAAAIILDRLAGSEEN
ncbi:MAG: tRNA (guanine37-N1)-methyltransferase [Thermodesulfobacteriota bacterium]|nr:tRNA (guanine37-N1)-methyltransferase [Thermodesulfobacteriota bacterium]